MANEQATITKAWLEMQIKALDAAIWTTTKAVMAAQQNVQAAQAKLAQLDGSKRAYEWMMEMLDQGKLGLLKLPGENLEPLSGE